LLFSTELNWLEEIGVSSMESFNLVDVNVRITQVVLVQKSQLLQSIHLELLSKNTARARKIIAAIIHLNQFWTYKTVIRAMTMAVGVEHFPLLVLPFGVCSNEPLSVVK
jgi:hypothetical protein